jgi:cholesterol oxidase
MPGPTSLQFTERMRGYVSLGHTDYQSSYEEGEAAGTTLMFKLTIRTDDIDRFVESPEHLADATGYVECDSLGGQLPVEHGWFNLFVETANRNQRRMLYRLHFRKPDGTPLTLSGFKLIEDNSGLEIWSDTTTLYVRVFNGHITASDEAAATIVASGIIHIYVRDFIKQLTTIRTEGPSLADRIAATEKFGRLFLGSLWDVYGSHCRPEE